VNNVRMITLYKLHNKLLRPRNDLYCVGWGVKLYSLTHNKLSYVSSESSHAVRQARHGQNAWAWVELCRVETSQVEFGLKHQLNLRWRSLSELLGLSSSVSHCTQSHKKFNTSSRSRAFHLIYAAMHYNRP